MNGLNLWRMFALVTLDSFSFRSRKADNDANNKLIIIIMIIKDNNNIDKHLPPNVRSIT